MTKTAHTRPFSREHAEAGAPVTRRDGIAARFLAYVPDAERYEQVLYLAKAGGRSIHSTSAEGRAAHSVEIGADLVMAPLGMVQGKPVFVDDQLINGITSLPFPVEPRHTDFDGCRWPVPERVYPETAMTAEELDRAWIGPQGLRKVANAALRHALDQGLVVLPGTAAPAPSQPAGAAKGRDGDAGKLELAIAKAVFNACRTNFTERPHEWIANMTAYGRLSNIDLPAIIASVKETAPE